MVLGAFTVNVDIGDAAGWVQALGTVLAVAVAIWLNNKQSKAADKLARRQHKESLLLLEKQHKQTIDRERRAYHRQVADKIVPITGLIEQWESILNDTIQFCRNADCHLYTEKRKRIRGQEASQVDDAIKRIDVQKIPDVVLVEKFIKIKNCSSLMVRHVASLKRGIEHQKVEETVNKLIYDRNIVVAALNEYRSQRDFHLNASLECDESEAASAIVNEIALSVDDNGL